MCSLVTTSFAQQPEPAVRTTYRLRIPTRRLAQSGNYSGVEDERCAVVTASPRILPDLICPITDVCRRKTTRDRPPLSATTAGPPPL